MMIWSNRIVMVLVVVSIMVFVPGSARASDLSDDDWDRDMEGPIIFAGAVLVGTSLFVTAYNCSRLDEDDPSKIGGVGGLMFGSVTALGGVAALFSESIAVQTTGVVCVAVGVITAWCGVKSLAAVRREHIEAEEQGLTFTPVLIEDGAGRLGPGIQVSWSF